MKKKINIYIRSFSATYQFFGSDDSFSRLHPPYISPIKAPILAVVSLLFPLVFVINILFIIFWVIRRKRYAFLSILAFALGFGYINSIYKLSGEEQIQQGELSLMSYNVRMFNHYQWSSSDSIAEKASHFIQTQSPDILSIQEYYNDPRAQFAYPYSYVKMKSKTHKFGLAIYSTFPIISSGSLELDSSSNNIIFADVVIKKDTVRVYNVHLESLGLNPNKENFGERDSDQLINRMKSAFRKQGIQTEKFLNFQKQWKGKSIVMGDFNNTAFSWVFKKISNHRQDAFREAGKGIGSTFDYSYPLRIDFILPDMDFEIHYFKTFDRDYSDHFPIMAKLSIKN